jgi:hypothetical protein
VIPRQIIRTGIAASAIAHLSVLMLVLFFTEVHPFGSVTAEPITVDLVPSEEVVQAPNKPEPAPEPKVQPPDAVDLSSKSAASSSPPPAAPPPAAPPAEPARPQKQAAASMPPANRQQASAQPQPPAASPTPAFTPPEPDLTIKYHVMLGLPPELPAEPAKGKSGDDFDAPALKAADLESSLVTEFRRHLKTCSKLPGSIAPTDKIRITLRTFLTPAGKLAAEPILIEASASAKGPALMQSAISALQACQPFAMLPADRYGEWKVLDLSFTPQDFAGG